MIVKIFDSQNDSSFGAIKYNEEKVEKGKAEIVSANNFPSHLDITNKEMVRKFFSNAIPKQNQNFKNVQFHAVISCKGKEYNSHQMKLVADDFMKNLGYNNQPYISFFHSDSKNNHLHIVSTNVDYDTGKRINNDFRKLKSQVALKESMKNILGIDYDKKLEKLLEYKFQNISQFEKLILQNGYNSYQNNNTLYIQKNGINIKDIDVNNISFSENINLERSKQIKEIIQKYSNKIDNNLFAITNNNNIISYKSKLQDELKKKLGLDLVLSFSNDKTPFGYIIIDNKTKEIFKGSDVVNLKNIFTFTDIKIEKQFFDLLENSHLKNEESKLAFKFYLENKYNYKVNDILLDFGKKTPYEDFKESKKIINGYIKGSVQDTINFNTNFSTIKIENNYYIVNELNNHFIDLREIVSEKNYERFQNVLSNSETKSETSSFPVNNLSEDNSYTSNNTISVISDIANALDKSSPMDYDDPKQKKRRRKNKFRR